jgi:hypothetical protein
MPRCCGAWRCQCHIRTWRLSAQLVLIVCGRTNTVFSLRLVPAYITTNQVGRPARLHPRPDSIPAVHSRSTSSHRAISPAAPSKCRRHSGLSGTFSQLAVTYLQNWAAACIDDVAQCMMANRLQLNTGKAEVLWCASARQQHQILQSGLRVCADVVDFDPRPWHLSRQRLINADT